MIAVNPTKRRRQYSLSFKLRVIRFFEKNSKNLALTSREFIVARKTIRAWIANASAIRSTNLKTRRARVNVKTVDYKVVFPLMENRLHAWIKSVRENGGCLDGRAIQAKAMSFMNEDDRSFTASRGWLMRFLHRKKLSLRRVTTKGRQPPKDLQKVVRNFIDDAESELRNVDRSGVFNMDETSIYLDFPSTQNFIVLQNFVFDQKH
jgi:hypothetical protein